jgi:hypothetical protein
MHRILILPDIRPDIWQGNLLSGRVPDSKKGRCIPTYKYRYGTGTLNQNAKNYPPLLLNFMYAVVKVPVPGTGYR